MIRPVARLLIILIAVCSRCSAAALDELFAQGSWPQYVAAAERALQEVPAERNTWHAASRFALAAGLAKEKRDPAVLADANFADAPTAQAVFLGATEVLDGDTSHVAVLADALRESRASLSHTAGW